MRCGHGGRGLITAGLLIVLIGLAVAGIRALELPGWSIPVAVGVALLLVGLLRRGAARHG